MSTTTIEREIKLRFGSPEEAREAVAAFGEGARHFGAVEALIGAVSRDAYAGTTMLVKGSRFMRMERVVVALTGAKTEGAH